jgi:hypothetical protein
VTTNLFYTERNKDNASRNKIKRCVCDGVCLFHKLPIGDGQVRRDNE